MRPSAVLALFLGVALCAASGSARAFSQDSLVWHKCSQCHSPAADGRLPGVEDLRTTPEEWTVIVDRMRRLHGMRLGEGEMDTLLKELTATQILTPDEQAAVAYLSLWHNSQQMEGPADPDEERLFATCVRCHSAGKIRSYRMTPANWAKLRDFHLFAVPTVVYQLREMHWITEADAVLQYLARKQPYGQAWSAPNAAPEGRWSVFGYEPGRGTYRGEASIVEAGDAEYRLTGGLRYADGTSETFSGEATLYGGYALRTRTRNNGYAVNGAFIVGSNGIRGESHFPAPHFRTSSSVWLRQGGAPVVARVTPGFLLAGERTTLVVEGIDLPDVAAADVSFAGGAVRVLGARRLAADAIEIEAESSAAAAGEAALTVKGLAGGTVRLAPRIDHIAITPQMGRARLSGGVNYPAEGVQFEAIAWGRTADGADVELGPVAATFTLAEEKTRPDDDDLRWAGGILPNGTYLPVGDYGSNPLRNFQAENSGLVRVVARYERGGQQYAAEAKLAVTMPDFIGRIR
jgi:quinohemoprotein amine dehydrogenase